MVKQGFVLLDKSNKHWSFWSIFIECHVDQQTGRKCLSAAAVTFQLASLLSEGAEVHHYQLSPRGSDTSTLTPLTSHPRRGLLPLTACLQHMLPSPECLTLHQLKVLCENYMEFIVSMGNQNVYLKSMFSQQSLHKFLVQIIPKITTFEKEALPLAVFTKLENSQSLSYPSHTGLEIHTDYVQSGDQPMHLTPVQLMLIVLLISCTSDIIILQASGESWQLQPFSWFVNVF